MKKLIIILIGAFTLLFGINVKASTFYTLDTPIAELNNHSLSEVFEHGNLVINGNFNSVSDWVLIRSTYTVNNNIATVVGNLTARNMGIVQVVNSVVGNEYYYYAEMMTPHTVSSIVLYFDNTLTNVVQHNPEPNLYYKMGAIRTITTNGRIEPNLAFTDTNGKTLNVRNVLVIDRTSLGIDNLTFEQMDYWFNVYQELLKDIDRVSKLPNQFIDIFGEFVSNFVIGFRGFTELIYIDGYGLTDLGIILLIVSSISVIGFGFYIIRKVIK